MSKFLVLEGDNGSGKSTVVALPGDAGLHIVSNDPKLKDAATVSAAGFLCLQP